MHYLLIIFALAKTSKKNISSLLSIKIHLLVYIGNRGNNLLVNHRMLI